jgi:hypothetical protein
MLLRQQFVVQLAITEVQWNQRLLVLRAFCWQAAEPTSMVLPPKKPFARAICG